MGGVYSYMSGDPGGEHGVIPGSSAKRSLQVPGITKPLACAGSEIANNVMIAKNRTRAKYTRWICFIRSMPFRYCAARMPIDLELKSLINKVFNTRKPFAGCVRSADCKKLLQRNVPYFIYVLACARRESHSTWRLRTIVPVAASLGLSEIFEGRLSRAVTSTPIFQLRSPKYFFMNGIPNC